MVKHGHLDVPVIGVAKAGWTLDQLRARARESIANHGDFDESAFGRLSGLLRYVDGDYNNPATFDEICIALAGARRAAHYLAIPPALFGTVVQQLGRLGCGQSGRVIVEKPFGTDLASARELNRILHSVFPERNDHQQQNSTAIFEDNLWEWRNKTCAAAIMQSPPAVRNWLEPRSSQIAGVVKVQCPFPEVVRPVLDLRSEDPTSRCLQCDDISIRSAVLSWSAKAVGIVKRNVVPLPGVLSTQIRPP